MKHGFKTTAPGACLALAAVVAALVPAHAAPGGDVPGAARNGAAACAAAVREYKGGMPNAMLVPGWMPGDTRAVSPTSFAGHGAFDFVPWHDLNTAANSIAGFCAQQPEMNLAQAVSGLTSALGHKRLKTAAAPLTLRSDGASLARYGKAIARMTRTLLAKGGSL